MKALVLVVAIAGCTSDPHEITTCEAGWKRWPQFDGPDITTCEAACAASPSATEDPLIDVEMSCAFSTPPNATQPSYCPKSWFREGGCCVPVGEGSAGSVKLYPCKDYPRTTPGNGATGGNMLTLER